MDRPANSLRRVLPIALVLVCGVPGLATAQSSEADRLDQYLRGNHLLVSYREGGAVYGTYYFLQVHYPIPTEPRTMSDECSLRISTLDLSLYRIIAVIEFDDVIVDVRADVTGPSDNFEAMEAFLLALKRR